MRTRPAARWPVTEVSEVTARSAATLRAASGRTNIENDTTRMSKPTGVFRLRFMVFSFQSVDSGSVTDFAGRNSRSTGQSSMTTRCQMVNGCVGFFPKSRSRSRLSQKLANQTLLFLVFNAREEFRAQLGDCFRLVEREFVVHLAVLKMTRHAT